MREWRWGTGHGRGGAGGEKHMGDGAGGEGFSGEGGFGHHCFEEAGDSRSWTRLDQSEVKDLDVVQSLVLTHSNGAC